MASLLLHQSLDGAGAGYLTEWYLPPLLTLVEQPLGREVQGSQSRGGLMKQLVGQHGTRVICIQRTAMSCVGRTSSP